MNVVIVEKRQDPTIYQMKSLKQEVKRNVAG